VTAFRDRSWSRRFAEMGDVAEQAFEDNFKNGFVRMGFNRPRIQMHKLPTKIRYTPDYLASDGFYECMGCGNDGIFKLKVDKFFALTMWNADFDTYLWVYDQKNHRYAYIKIADLMVFVDAGRFKRGTFPEGKDYWEIPTYFFTNWRDCRTPEDKS
jgi:hypothetical protein